jgi:hypothetical protein
VFVDELAYPVKVDLCVSAAKKNDVIAHLQERWAVAVSPQHIKGGHWLLSWAGERFDVDFWHSGQRIFLLPQVFCLGSFQLFTSNDGQLQPTT